MSDLLDGSIICSKTTTLTMSVTTIVKDNLIYVSISRCSIVKHYCKHFIKFLKVAVSCSICI